MLNVKLSNERKYERRENSFRGINDIKSNFTVTRGDIYFARLGETEGSEQGGIRPVLVISCAAGNLHSSTTIVAAITSQINKCKLPVHVELKRNEDNNLEKDSVVLLEQVRTLSKTRFISKLGHLNDAEMQRVNKALLISVGLFDNIAVNEQSFGRIERKEVKKDIFDINRARHIADKINECQNRINNNLDKNITNKLLRDKMSYISELKMYCKSFNQDYRFYYNSNNNNVRGTEREMVINA